MRFDSFRDMIGFYAGKTPDAPALLREFRSDAQRLEEDLLAGGDTAGALGELLFDLVKIARFSGADPEAAIHAKCEDYIRAFRLAEEQTGK